VSESTSGAKVEAVSSSELIRAWKRNRDQVCLYAMVVSTECAFLLVWGICQLAVGAAGTWFIHHVDHTTSMELLIFRGIVAAGTLIHFVQFAIIEPLSSWRAARREGAGA